MTFEELDLTDDVLDALYDMNFSECTPIQEQAIPVALSGRDLIAVAQTGTGKTAAFLLPVINELGRRKPSDHVKCLVMTPTRELAMQIDAQMDGFSYFLPISSLAIYGGTDGKGFSQQQKALKSGAEVIIATPGRLLAHLQMGCVDLSEVEFFILDEADRMLDMGFYDDIMQIVSRLPEVRRTMMFSATMPPKIQKLAKTVLTNPVEIKIAVSRPTEKIVQLAYICGERAKTPILRHLFDTVSSKKVIVFVSSKLKVRELCRELRRFHYKVAEMHSDLDQTARDTVMRDFRNNHIDILVATDILSRGIDIDDISMVVNYDVPHDPEDYVHRIGRTARANADGTAVTLVGERDRRKFRFIERFLGYEVTKGEVPGLTATPEDGQADEQTDRRQKSRGEHKKQRRDKHTPNPNKRPKNMPSNDGSTSEGRRPQNDVQNNEGPSDAPRNNELIPAHGNETGPKGRGRRDKQRRYSRRNRKANNPTAGPADPSTPSTVPQ